jgi:uncharacterized repeat protein (TIGR03803 family)
LVTDLSGKTLYGTTAIGGSPGLGTVFAVNTDGTGFTNLHNFIGVSDGSQPYAGLVLSGTTLYGTTAEYGGSSLNGTVFAVHTDGTGFTNLHSFTATSGFLATNSDGTRSYAGLILSGNTLYGTASEGGGSGNGTVFALNTDGTDFRTLHSFTASFDPYYTNSDGAYPYGELFLSGNALYGTATGGGSSARGTVFKVNTDGTGFTNLHSFTPAEFNPDTNPSSTNSDGVNPKAGLILSGDTLYGTTIGGGGFGRGTVFALNTNGTGFTALHSFAGYDGAYAREELSLSGNTLYGTAQTGGNFGGGTVFALNTNGTGFTTLHSFNYGSSDGSEPYSGVTLFGNTLYGTTRGYGGSYGAGTVFSLSFTPQLTITPSGANVILSWPTNVAGFDYTAFTLQSTTNLTPAAWSPVAQAAVTNAGQVSIDVPTSGGRKFFRLNSQEGTLPAFLKTFSSSQKMSYCGLVAPAYTGHLNPITVLGHELRRRGHRLAVVTPLPARAKEKSAGLAFLPVWASSYRSRSLPLPRCGRQCSVC